MLSSSKASMLFSWPNFSGCTVWYQCSIWRGHANRLSRTFHSTSMDIKNRTVSFSTHSLLEHCVNSSTMRLHNATFYVTVQFVIYAAGLVPSYFFEVLGAKDFAVFKKLAVYAILLIVLNAVVSISIVFILCV